MRETVTRDWLAKEIDSKMGYPGRDRTKFWTSVEILKRRVEGGPNWRYSFNAGAVPAGFEKRWAEIRQKLEDTYQVPEE